MEQATLWLNKGLSSIYNVIQALRAAAGQAYRIVCTHTNPDFPAQRLADVFELEPRGLSESGNRAVFYIPAGSRESRVTRLDPRPATLQPGPA